VAPVEQVGSAVGWELLNLLRKNGFTVATGPAVGGEVYVLASRCGYEIREQRATFREAAVAVASQAGRMIWRGRHDEHVQLQLV
jgi:hypothetical protein